MPFTKKEHEDLMSGKTKVKDALKIENTDKRAIALHYIGGERLKKETGEKIKVIPGKIRETEVIVGRHVPPLAENIDRFMERFEQAYDPNRLSQVQQIIAIAASHHRFVWIHPFLDGNGRVVRLLSHAYFLYTGIGCSLWSVSRGLAKNVEEYKSALMAADAPRKGDLDGRGTLSQENLIRFCVFFLESCIDQIRFMKKLIDPDELQKNVFF